MDVPAYADLEEKLSQGDIVAEVPWGVADDPLLVCRPHHATSDDGQARYKPADKWADPAAFNRGRRELTHFPTELGLALVLWHDCELDKFEKKGKPPSSWFAGVLPILSMANMDAENIQRTQELQKTSAFPLPAAPELGIAEPSYVDFRHILPVKQSLLKARKGTLSTQMRNALYAHLFRFFTRKDEPPPSAAT